MAVSQIASMMPLPEEGVGMHAQHLLQVVVEEVEVEVVGAHTMLMMVKSKHCSEASKIQESISTNMMTFQLNSQAQIPSSQLKHMMV